jgi:hypothetical protein
LESDPELSLVRLSDNEKGHFLGRLFPDFIRTLLEIETELFNFATSASASKKAAATARAPTLFLAYGLEKIHCSKIRS